MNLAGQRHTVAVFAAAILTSAAWMAIVPPFEGPDELYFYSQARYYAEHPEPRQNLFFWLTSPIVRLTSPSSGPVEPRRNPAFRFVGNRRGEVNRWVQDRPGSAREHIRALLALRVLVACLAAVTIVLIDGIAGLCLTDRSLRWAVVALAIWIPQASFTNVIVHREVMTRLLGAAVTLVVVARATGRLARWSTWVLLLCALAVAPLADRQAYFLVPFAALALIATERRWWARCAAALAIAVPVAIAAWLVQYWVEIGTNLSGWMALVRHPLRPFFTSAVGFGYYAFEFAPKLFMGFWGWMGQPSILLPAPIFGALAVLSALSFGGLIVRMVRHRSEVRPEDEQRRVTARRLLAAGVTMMAVPIAYSPVVTDPNLWYGRWLFPMLGPIVMGFVVGLAEIVGLARRAPHRIALALAIMSAAAVVIWVTPAGAAVRAGIVLHHYGDPAQIIEMIRDGIVILCMVSVAVELKAHIRWPALGPNAVRAGLVTGIALLNGVLLLAFVRPLYSPMTPGGYVDLIEGYLRTRQQAVAADVFASALKSYPNSPELNDLAERSPRVLLGGRLDEMFGLLERRFARGGTLRDRDALFALAARLREVTWTTSESLNAVLADAEGFSDLAEAAALVRLELSHRADDAAAADGIIRAGHGTRLMRPVRNREMVIEGFTVTPNDPLPREATQLVLYLRMNTDPANRRVWLHVYPAGRKDYLVIDPTIAPQTWRAGELIWQVYDLPEGDFTAYVGLWVGTDIGEGVPLGRIPR